METESTEAKAKLEQATILVVGGNGYLGRFLVTEASALGYEVLIGSRTIAQDDYTNVHVDVRNPLSIQVALTKYKPTHIVNFAGLMSGSLHEMTQTNLVGSVNVLEAVREVNRDVKVTLIGSAAEYGDGGGQPLDEEAEHKPLGDYGLSKSLQAGIIPYFAGKGVQVNLARIFNVDGDGMPPHTFPGRIDSQIELIRRKKASEILVGDLEAVRDYLHPTEVAQKVLRVALNGSPGHVYNVASGIGQSNREVLESRLALAGLSLDLIKRDPSYSSVRSGGLAHSVACIEKHNSLLPVSKGRGIEIDQL